MEQTYRGNGFKNWESLETGVKGLDAIRMRPKTAGTRGTRREEWKKKSAEKTPQGAVIERRSAICGVATGEGERPKRGLKGKRGGAYRWRVKGAAKKIVTGVRGNGPKKGGGGR